MKQANKNRLQADLIRICDQIGILPNERPKLVFNSKEFNEIELQHSDAQSQKAVDCNLLGMCIHSARTIFVRESPHLRNGKVRRKEYFKKSDFSACSRINLCLSSSRSMRLFLPSFCCNHRRTSKIK